MKNDLHDIDHLFRSALDDNEETPTASVKESLLAHLDKKDAASYKKRFLWWKRAAILLLFLLAGFILYDSGIVKTGTGDSTKKLIIKTQEAGIPGKNAISDPGTDNTTIDETRNKQKEVISKRTGPAGESISDNAQDLKTLKQKDNGDVNTDKSPGKKNLAANTPNMQKNKQLSRPIKSLTNNYKETARDLPKEKISIAPRVNKIDWAKIDDRPFSSLRHRVAPKSFMPAGIDSLLKNNTVKNVSPKRIHHFKPYWTITGLVTYDRVNYKLDSDLPANITSIKHGEVHEPSFSVSMLATRQLKEKWGLQTGLIYSNTAIGIGPQKIYALQDPAGDIAYKYITSSGYVYIKPGFGSPPAFGDSLITTEAKHSLHSLTIPIVIKYTIGKNRLLFLPGAGLEANIITRAKLETEIEDANNRETVFLNKLNGAKSFYWSLVADAEIRYAVNKKLSFSVRPVFRYAISPITENNVVETFPYSFGVGLGLGYKF